LDFAKLIFMLRWLFLLALPGHGQAASQTPQGMPGFVHALEATRTRLKDRQLILVGHSFGALFANLIYKYLPGLGHYLMLDNPAMLNEELLAFLRRSKQP
jgi:pimeloyl-ACP methyl ester carboxylesterase